VAQLPPDLAAARPLTTFAALFVTAALGGCAEPVIVVGETDAATPNGCVSYRFRGRDNGAIECTVAQGVVFVCHVDGLVSTSSTDCRVDSARNVHLIPASFPDDWWARGAAWTSCTDAQWAELDLPDCP
jgi:hypothetical protein